MKNNKLSIFITSIVLMLSACSSDDRKPIQIEDRIDTDLLVLKTDEIRIIEAKRDRIAYEYNDQSVTLAQIGLHAKKYCSPKAKDTILVNMILTNRHNYRRAYFICSDEPVLIPNYMN
ncbi:MAG: hypothetical protein MJ247_00140 [Alphaproteobacteria bacterium]|nr:hypothetical protein [Alphaproteobacteria bacterium]